MSYQIPNLVKILQLRDLSKVGLYRFTPTDDVKLKNIIVTMYIRGLLASDFQMKINVYLDSLGRRKLFESDVVSNFDIDRSGDFYCEQRFDFPAASNLLALGHEFYVEFELLGTYAFDEANYLGLIIDHDSPLAILASGSNVIRHSAFYDIA